MTLHKKTLTPRAGYLARSLRFTDASARRSKLVLLRPLLASLMVSLNKRADTSRKMTPDLQISACCYAFWAPIFDHGDQGRVFERLQAFGVPTGTTLSVFLRASTELVSAVQGTEKSFKLSDAMVLGVVRTSLSREFPVLVPMPHPGASMTVVAPFVSVSAMRLAFELYATNTHQPLKGRHFFLLPPLEATRHCRRPRRRWLLLSRRLRATPNRVLLKIHML